MGSHCYDVPTECYGCAAYAACSKPAELASCDAHCDTMPETCCSCAKYAICLGRDYDPTAPPLCREPAAQGCTHCTPYVSCVQSGRGFGPNGKCVSRVTCSPTCCDCFDYIHCAANSQAQGCSSAPEKCGTGTCDISCMWRTEYVASCPGVSECGSMPAECNQCLEV